MTADEKITDLIHHYQVFCRRIAFHFVQDYDTAEDVVQNAFVKAYLALQRYTPQQQEELQARPWLQKIVLNEARTVLANKCDLLRLTQAETEEVEGPEEEQPEVVVLYAEEKTALDDLLKLLPRKAQEIIEFWFRFGPSYQEIAEALDKDAKTLRTRFHRATQRLKYLVNEKQIPESDVRQWLRANLLTLEQEWVDGREISRSESIFVVKHMPIDLEGTLYDGSLCLKMTTYLMSSYHQVTGINQVDRNNKERSNENTFRCRKGGNKYCGKKRIRKIKRFIKNRHDAQRCCSHSKRGRPPSKE